jgi:glucose uptake protein GlcU
MLEYTRLLNKDAFSHFFQNWTQHDTVVLGFVLAVVVVVGLFVARK